MKSLEDMSILITGGGSGIGAATARAFSDAGAEIVVADLIHNAGGLGVTSVEGAATRDHVDRNL